MAVFVHIGYHKTGSTAIQTAVSGLRGRLVGVGIDVPVGLSSWLGHPEIAWAFEGANYPWQDRIYCVDEVIDTYQPIFEAATTQGRNVLVSSEEFCRLDFQPERLSKLAEFISPYDPQIIGFVRDPLQFLLSRWRHETQMGAEQRPLVDFLRDQDNLLSADFERRTRAWVIAFGDRCNFRDYAAEVGRHGSIIVAFLRELGVTLAPHEVPASTDHEVKLHPLLCDLAQSISRSRLGLAEQAAAFKRLFEFSESWPALPLGALLDCHPLPREVVAVLDQIRFAMVKRGLLS